MRKSELNHCYYCKGNGCKYLHKQFGMKKWVFMLILITIILGIIVPFSSEVVLTIWFPDVTLGIETWNQFVSIILGIVATVLSIVSMIMGFKNYDDALSIQEKYMQALKEIKLLAKDLSNVKDDVHTISSMRRQIPVDTPTEIPSQWEKEE